MVFGHPLYWACQAFGWGGIWTISLLHVLIDSTPAPVSHLNGSTLFLALATLSHFYRIGIWLNNWRTMTWWKLLPRVVISSAVIALAATLLIRIFVPLEHSPINPSRQVPDAHLFFLTISNFLIMLSWSGIYFGYHFQVDYQKIQVNQLRLQVSLREAEHRALSAQIKPHFLFNSLNVVRSLIEENPTKAREAVTQLARLFRASLKTTRKNLISLREELETVNSYLSLEQSRFENRLVVQSNVSTDALEAKIPPFLLQTLIENAIKYGVGSQATVEISYSAYLDKEGLKLQVTNPGQIRSPRDSTIGMGLENSHLRLRLLFGCRASLGLRSMKDNRVSAEALIPQLTLES